MTIDDWRARYDHLNAETDRLRAEVERLREDAARAGEARAVKALRAVVAAVLPHEEDTWIMGGVALRHVHRVLDQYEPTLDNQPSALDWLAQQRAEAVAAWIEKEATKCRQQNGEYYDRGVDCMLREAAALRAGEVGND